MNKVHKTIGLLSLSMLMMLSAVAPQTQKEDYSGKSKDHTSNNEIVSDDASQVLYLSPTYEDKTPDKALLDTENLAWLPGISLRQDTGYQAYRPSGLTIVQPTKKPRGADRAAGAVEHSIAGIKRLRILKDRIRLHSYEVRDRLINIGCGLHNLRVKSPFRAYAPRTGVWAITWQIFNYQVYFFIFSNPIRP